MTGIFLLIVVGLWLWACVAMTRALMRRWKGRPWGVPLACLAFVALLIAPVADEIVGKFQFDALCAKYAVEVIDEARARNSRVFAAPREMDALGTGAAVHIGGNQFRYLDEQTNDLLASFHVLSAKGGWFIRLLGISQTSSPLTFKAGCAPPNAFGFLKTLNMTVLN
jgi:hypothetical protein